MRKAFTAFAAAISMFVTAQPAAAAQFLLFEGPIGVFGNLDITCPAGQQGCWFSNDFWFENPVGYDLLSVGLTSVFASPETRIEFSEVTMDFIAPFVVQNGPFYSRAEKIGHWAGAWDGENILTVSGWSGGHGAYAGTLAFAWSGYPIGVPEPSTWLMMIVGIGAIGMVLRRPEWRTRSGRAG